MKHQACLNLTDLLGQLRKVFDDDHVNVEEVMDLMDSYKSNRADWIQYAKFDPHKYTRNLVDAGNGKYNVMVLCWGEGMGSSIHDHANAHCFVKVLDGQLKETRYEWPQEEGDRMAVKQVTTYDTNGVNYMSDALGLHRMENPSHTDVAITLHVYIPAFDECSVFDERTGHKTKCKVTFWSKYGQKVDYSKPIEWSTISWNGTAWNAGNGSQPAEPTPPAPANQNAGVQWNTISWNGTEWKTANNGIPSAMPSISAPSNPSAEPATK